MTGLNSLTKKILIGNFLFAACCIAYLAWWSVAFRPDYTASMNLKGGLFVVTALLGISGLALILESCAQTKSPVRASRVIVAGAVILITLVLLTLVLLHRMVTTELMLIVFWACMETCICGSFCGEGAISHKAFVISEVIVLCAAAAGMVCYLMYYELEPMTAFYDGMVPLVLFAAVNIGISLYPIVKAKRNV